MSGALAVRCLQPDCGNRVVHDHTGGEYGLEDIPELFQLGQVRTDPQGRERVVLTAAEIRELKVLADAYSFDFEPGLIELCLDLHRFAIERPENEFELIQEA